MNEKKELDFLTYINSYMNKDSIVILYAANNIKLEKCELFNDFIQSLLSLISSTYLGDTYTPPNEQLNHFNWCWKKNIQNFNDEGIFFNSKILYEYFFEYMMIMFYSSEKKVIKVSIDLWNGIFDYNREKTNADIDTLIEIYKIFQDSLIK